MSGAPGRRLDLIARLAHEAGVPVIAADAAGVAERLADGRFYVVCMGQFKRGKSTLLNALVGDPLLPTGVVPITAAVTVIRYGDTLGARVRFTDRDWEEVDPRGLSTYVSEEHNPGNEKGVTAVEVFVPSPLLHSGMCLVDTPGIGSVSIANTAATRAFLPHIDAALIVLGADPPITGEEFDLVAEVAPRLGGLLVVLSKADRVPEADRDAAVRFIERVMTERLRRPVGPIFEVSATERLDGRGPLRDWERLLESLRSLATASGADLVRTAEQRETAALVARLLYDLDEQESALRRPIAESEQRITALRAAIIDAERSVADLGHLLTGEQERLARRFTEERDAFFAQALPAALAELSEALSRDPARGPKLRRRAIDLAIAVTERWLDRWRTEQEPKAEALYREAEERFIEVANSFQRRLGAVPGLEALGRLDAHPGFRARSHFHYTAMLHVAPFSFATWLIDTILGSRRAIERDAVAHLERLLAVNSTRIKNDFEARVVESRRSPEADVRERLRQIGASAEQALERARAAQASRAAAVEQRLAWVARVRSDTLALADEQQRAVPRGL